jgi:LemA protein
MLYSLLNADNSWVGWVIGIVAVILVIAVIGWWISTRNHFVTLKNKLEEAWATIDVYLKKRYDLIPNLVETVKGYAKHESETLQQVVAARNMSAGARTLDEKMEAANQMTGSLRTFLSAVAENYPDLKANTNFLDLQQQLKSLESELESSRRYYNGTVKSFNTKLEIFPANLVANGMGEEYKKRPYFELDSAEERRNVSVKF